MNEKEKEICEDYGFLFCDNVENPAVRLTAIGWQKRNSREYYWDNRERPFGFLFQYTLKGSGTLKTGGPLDCNGLPVFCISGQACSEEADYRRTASKSRVAVPSSRTKQGMPMPPFSRMSA